VLHSNNRHVFAIVATVVMTSALLTRGGTALAAENQARARDTTPPDAPTFASTDYPAGGPTTVAVGGSGRITLTSTDPGRHATGVASFAFNIDGTSINSGGSAGTARARDGHATVRVPLTEVHWGTNILWAQAVDGAGNRSPVATYSFFVQQSAFGPPSPGLGGDITGDGVPDLVTVDAAGDIHLFAQPGATTVDPTGDTTADPHQYGGRVIVPAHNNARWPIPDSASAAGALVSHSGSFTGNSVDDVLVLQNGFLGVAGNPGTAATWVFAVTNVPRPACATCANYNNQDWSSVTQMVAVQTAPSGPPNLLTVEVVNDTATLWWYAAGNGIFYQAPRALSVNTASWHWDDLRIVGAGALPGSSGVSLWMRDPGTGTVYLMHDVVGGTGDPAASATAVATGVTTAAYPLLTSPGLADNNGNLPLWATDANGRLVLIPTTTSSAGVTSVFAPTPISQAGWAGHEIALGSSYPTYDNRGIAAAGTPNGAFDTTTANAFAYSADALATATVDPDAIVNDGSGGCPTGWTSCVAGLGSTTAVALPNDLGGFDTFALPAPWANRRDNYTAAGQVLPVPVPETSGPAHTIRFLGAAATTDVANGASVNATVTYTDGHTQTVTVTLANWTQDLGTAPVAGDTTVATMDHRAVAATGAADPTTNYLFATAGIILRDNGAALPADVQIASVRLGTNAAVHIFGIAVS
jgi:hypothetical protein